MESFLVSFASNSQIENFPSNTSAHFRTSLNHEITGKFEIALGSLSFKMGEEGKHISISTPEEGNVQEDSAVSVPKTLLFNLNSNDDEIIFHQEKIYILQAKNFYTNVLNFMDELNSFMETQQMKLQFLPLISDGKSFCKIKYSDEGLRGYSVRLPNLFAQSLGFSSQFEFSIGEHLSDLPCDDAIFQANFHAMEFIPITFYGDAKYVIKISEPASLSIHDVVESIENAFENSDFEIGIVLMEHDKILLVRIYSSFTSLAFSGRLNEYLGLPTDFKFTKPDTTIFLPDGLFIEKREEDATELARLARIKSLPTNKIFVLCNLVNCQFFSDKLIPYIAIIDKPEEGKIESINFKSPRFLDINTDAFQMIEISLRSESGELISCDNLYPSFVTLIFKHL